MARTRTDPSVYSKRWLSWYGRSLNRTEIRLVQGFRGLTASQQEAVQTVVSSLITDNLRERRPAARRRAR